MKRGPPWIWFAPWSWRREELRPIAVWAVVIGMILSALAPPVLPLIGQLVQGIGYVCVRGWIAVFSMLQKPI